MLETLARQLEPVGYVPNTKFVLLEVKGSMLYSDSERLAIAFGLLDNKPLIKKYLCLCGDCHIVIELISKIVRRENIVSNASHIHNFKDGSYSCGNHW